MIKITTRDFGEMEIPENSFYTFPTGLPGFDETRKYALICPKGRGEFPMFLQCAEDIFPCFIVCDVKMIVPKLKISLSPAEERLLKTNEHSDIHALFIVNIMRGLPQATVNMKSPVVINEDEKLAAQIILSDKYDYRYPLFKKEIVSSNPIKGDINKCL